MAPRRRFERSPASHDREDGLRRLQVQLEHSWKQREIMLQALRHPSAVSDGRSGNRLSSNQRLEFLGDSVLDLIVVMHLMNVHPTEGEGFLSATRARMVNQKALALRAKNLGLDRLVEIEPRSEYLLSVESTLADCLEAIIGSAFIDAGGDLKVAHTVIKNAGVLG